MDKTIEVYVNGSYIRKNSNSAGVEGEVNATILHITFDDGWSGFAKRITFWDSRGETPVEILLTSSLLVNTAISLLEYNVTIPSEPLKYEGEITYVIDGYRDGAKKRAQDTLFVGEALTVTNAPVDPTPTQAEQLQEQIEEILEDIVDARAAAGEAAKSEANAKESETNALLSEKAAKLSEEKASLSEENALLSENVAALSEKNAMGFAADAEGSALSAAESAAQAADAAEKAEESASNANADAEDIREKVSLAEGYKESAAESESNAHLSAEAASISEENAAKSEENAAKSAQEAKSAAESTSNKPYDETPEMDGKGNAGISGLYARGDHVHPRDTTKSDKPKEFAKGNLAEFDEEGNPVDSGKKVGDFVTLDGSIPMTGTLKKEVDGTEYKYYSEDNKPTLLELGARPRKNLLDNPRFKVNQRGQTTYESTDKTYVNACDRCRVRAGLAELVDDGVDLIPLTTITDFYFIQKLPVETTEALLGKTVTLSILYNDTELFTVTVIAKEGNSINKAVPNVNLSLYFNISLIGDNNGVFLYRYSPTEDSKVKLNAWKLEIGEGQTLAYKDENGNWQLYDDYDYTADLLECQRYYFTIDSHCEFLGYIDKNKNITTLVHAPVAMVAVPTPIISGTVVYVVYSLDKRDTLDAADCVWLCKYGSVNSQPNFRLYADFPESVDETLTSYKTLSFHIENAIAFSAEL